MKLRSKQVLECGRIKGLCAHSLFLVGLHHHRPSWNDDAFWGTLNQTCNICKMLNMITVGLANNILDYTFIYVEHGSFPCTCTFAHTQTYTLSTLATTAVLCDSNSRTGMRREKCVQPCVWFFFYKACVSNCLRFFTHEQGKVGRPTSVVPVLLFSRAC